MATSVRGEIECQQTLDRHWGNYQDALQARLAAVLGARRAFMERQIGAEWELRLLVAVVAMVIAAFTSEDAEAAVDPTWAAYTA